MKLRVEDYCFSSKSGTGKVGLERFGLIIFLSFTAKCICSTPNQVMGDNGNGMKYDGILFRDHDDGPADRHKVFIISDAFENFLKQKGVKFERQNLEDV